MCLHTAHCTLVAIVWEKRVKMAASPVSAALVPLVWQPNWSHHSLCLLQSVFARDCPHLLPVGVLSVPRPPL